MNKIAIISDIHGNYPAFEAVLKDIENEKVDRIICLGDLVGFYCMINEVINEIRRLEIPTILGNHDFALIHKNGIIKRSKTCTLTLQKQLKYISSENLNFLHNLKKSYFFNFNDKSFFCVHGGLKNNIDEYLVNIDSQYFEENDFKFDFLLTGHTHMPVINNFHKKKHINPGSVGQPRDGNNKASYSIITHNNILIKRIEYNIDILRDKMRKEKFDDYITDVLYRGVRIGK